MSQKEVNSLQNQLARTKTELENQLRLSQNQVEKAAVGNREFVVKSNLSGVVLDVGKEVGESVLPQEPLGQIGDVQSFILEMLIDEDDIAKIEIGQKALIRLEAYAEQVFEATVSKIAPKMDSRNQTFLVEAQFRSPPKKLYMGLSGEANIVVQEKQQAVVIPIAYLTEDNQVMTTEGAVAVKIGLKSLDQVEVLSPIDTSTLLLKPE